MEDLWKFSMLRPSYTHLKEVVSETLLPLPMLPPLSWWVPFGGLLGLASILGGGLPVMVPWAIVEPGGSAQGCIRIIWGPLGEIGVPPRTVAPGPSFCMQ